MEDYVITCCSTADMPREFFESRGIPFACFHYFLNGQEYLDDLGRSMPMDAFYQAIRQGALPTTSQVNVREYEELFEPILKSGRDVLHIELSSGISGSIGSARLAAKQLMERWPGRRVVIADSLAASSGYGLLTEAAWEKKQEGLSLDELSLWLSQNRLRLHHWFFSSDLTHFRRGGRISAPSAFFGSMLNICPLMNVNSQGKLIPREKIRGKNRVIRQLAEQMALHAQDGKNYSGRCLIAHSACPEDAQAAASLIGEAFPRIKGGIQIESIGAVIGSHTGPGTVALFFWGDLRTD